MIIKRFKNLWTMGLILIVVIYAIYFILKLVNPQFIVGIAELPGVVAFGNYVDTHPWAYYLFNGIISFVTISIYCCACCRKKRLNYREHTLVLADVIIGFLLYAHLPRLAIPFNYATLIILPVIMIRISNADNIKYLYSTCICFAFHTLLQEILASIRDVMTFVTYPNSATFTILMIDGIIWLFGLYLFYNKGGKQNG